MCVCVCVEKMDLEICAPNTHYTSSVKRVHSSSSGHLLTDILSDLSAPPKT